ncbi:MAG TPA: LssY C-terminal domain-containing protein, partial [Thiolinea sp.]|nr:LssY C-terminal domain-containing protein [Thiolinea sp.]
QLAVLILVLLAGLISVSRIYLGAHWPSDVLGSLFFSTLLVLVFAQVFRHEPVAPMLARKVLLLAGVSYVLLTAWHVSTGWDSARQKYQRRPPVPMALTQPWLEGGWRNLPAYRQDLHGEQEEPFLLQWQGSLEQLQQALPDWSVAPALSLAGLNGLVVGSTPAAQLPALPKLQAGKAEVLALQQADTDGRFVLRLYPQQVVEPDGTASTIWLGTVTREQLYHPLRQLSLLLSDDEQRCTAPSLLQLPHARPAGSLRQGSPEYAGCGGEVVLGK